MAGIVYKCDPSLNTVCKKKLCYLNGGTCFMTRNIDFAKKPIETATIVMAATKEDLEAFVGIEFANQMEEEVQRGRDRDKEHPQSS